MKRNTIITLTTGLAAILLITISCNKDQPAELSGDPSAMTLEIEEDAIVMEDILDEVMEDLEKYEFLKSTVTCPERTITLPESGRYPKIVTKDFGDGCQSNPNGVVRSGKIIITLWGPWHKEGSKRKVTFENYMHGQTLIEGSKHIECMGESDDGHIWHTIKGRLKLTREKDGDILIIKRLIEKDRYLISDLENRDIPREWLIEGKVEVKKSNGVSYVVKTAVPLYRIQGCRWFQAGLKQIELGDDLIQIDYSFVGPEDSACDSWIQRWVNDGEPEQINLSAR